MNIQISALDLDAYWMPFNANREFKRNPRMVVGARGAYFEDITGRRIFDGHSGHSCSGLGHCRPEITAAIHGQLSTLDYAPVFQLGHPLAFKLAQRLKSLAPGDLNHVFFACSGADAVDTALKITRAYWRRKGISSKTKFIGRAKAYHGSNFGGTSVGGIGEKRESFGGGIDVDHLQHTLLARNAFTRGVPAHGAELADELLDLLALHGSSNIAAVIVEPFSGSAGAIIPPKGYLQRLREICIANDILLIFDEIITAFGRAGAMFGAEAFGVVPDVMTVGKQITNGTIPLSAVIVSEDIYQTFMADTGPDFHIELHHGYTYSAHPVACAAALATLDVIEQEKIIERVSQLAPHFENAVHGLRELPYVVDIRNFGLAAGVTLETTPSEVGRRPFEVSMHCWRNGFYVRYGHDTIQLSPPFISEKAQIDLLVEAVGNAIKATR